MYYFCLTNKWLLMKVFKFGGASVRDADSVRNVFNILSHYANSDLLVVFSAMGKTTNALEKVANAWMKGSGTTRELLERVFDFHLKVAAELNLNYSTLSDRMQQLLEVIESIPPQNYDEGYDRIVSFGELISTELISRFLDYQEFHHSLIDCRNLIKTDNTYRSASINWSETQNRILSKIPNTLSIEESNRIPAETGSNIFITQGFIGSSLDDKPVTLGREGSDFSAAIFAWALEAEEVIIWKDVPGVLNADPRYFPDTLKLESMSFRDAIELAYYGASVIHPKTIQPLKSKFIPLKVKSFYKPDDEGTLIKDMHDDAGYKGQIPCFISKPRQVLISISPKDFSFIAEGNLYYIFGLLSSLGIHLNMMQLSAISFSMVTDENHEKTKKLFELLNDEYNVRYNEDLQLITIRYYDQETINKVVGSKIVYLEQKSRTTVQIVIGA